jgi:LmbE family N-acetylglucosaminyl deacetylase
VTLIEAPGTDGIERVLAVMAHPDDVDFSAAGTIAAWTSAGVQVSYCILTSGDAGGFDDTPRAEMPILRQKEQRAAAAVVGVSDVTFLGFADGTLYPTLEMRLAITREIRKVRPQRVICPSPERDYLALPRSHPDHRAVGSATLDSVYPDARNPFAHPQLLADEGLEAWTVGEVWIPAGTDATHHVDITDTFPLKYKALREHVSQTSHMENLEMMLRERGGRAAQDAGLPDGRIAERFLIVNTG